MVGNCSVNTNTPRSPLIRTDTHNEDIKDIQYKKKRLISIILVKIFTFFPWMWPVMDYPVPPAGAAHLWRKPDTRSCNAVGSPPDTAKI